MMMPTIQPTILLITTHPQLTYLIKRYGEQSACHVISAGTIETALESMIQDRPAMVLLHLMVWPHDDWQTLRRLKEHSAIGNIPITIISALADEERARHEGAAYWLWQPVMYADFRAALAITGVLPQIAAPRHIVATGG
jgi:DNA-binding response OmpR family regulator